jgi:hypothetical protein
MSRSPVQPLFDSLGHFRLAWPKRGWSWDTRVSCVASSFGADTADEARTALKLAFPHSWTHRTTARAPAVLQQIAERTGGIRADQVLYATEACAGVIAFGLWWPWGDDTTISYRVGLSSTDHELEELLRETFGVTMM